MNIYLQALVKESEENKLKYQAYKACLAAGVKTPEELSDLFDDEYKPEEFELIDLLPVAKKLDEYCRDSFEIDLKDLPEGTVKIKFVASW